MAEKSWGQTVKGWFIVDESARDEVPETPPAKPGKPDAADDIIRRYSGGGEGPGRVRGPMRPPSLDADRSPAKSPSGEAPPDFGVPSEGSPPVTSGGAVDFTGVFRQAGIDDAQADRVEKALGLLGNLPPDTPLATRKLIVETSLKAFGVPIESIIETAVAEIQALHGCIESGAADMQRLLDDSQKRIASLEQQTAQIREIMESRKQEQRALESQARVRGLSVQQILEFFGQERVGQVVQDSPRLESPKPGPAKR